MIREIRRCIGVVHLAFSNSKGNLAIVDLRSQVIARSRIQSILGIMQIWNYLYRDQEQRLDG